MADIATLGLRVDAAGFIRSLDSANKALDQTASKGGAAERAINNLSRSIKSALAIAGVGIGLREVMDYADSWKLVESRLRLVTSSTGQMRAAQQALFEMSQRTRSSFEATAELYTRVARNAEQLGKSQLELAQFTETVQKTMKLSGASTQEASAGVIQLGQALASGVLRGDEFRSIMENMPGLARAMAQGLGVPIGALRQMANQGELTGDKVVNAVLKMKDSIDRDFKTVPTTVSDAFTVMGNEVRRFVGLMDSSSGASASAANGIIRLSENLPRVAAGLAAVTAAWIAYRTAAIAAAAMTVIVAGAGTIGAFLSLALSIRKAADAMALMSLLGGGLKSVLATVAAIGVGFAAYKLVTNQIAEATEKFRGELEALSGASGAGAGVAKLSKEFKATAAAMAGELAKATALNAAYRQTELQLGTLEILYDAAIENSKLAADFKGRELTALVKLNDALADQKIKALELAEAQKQYNAVLERQLEVRQQLAALRRNLSSALDNQGFGTGRRSAADENAATAAANYKRWADEANATAKKFGELGKAAEFAARTISQAAEYWIVQKLGGGSAAGNLSASVAKGVFQDNATGFAKTAAGAAIFGPLAAGLGAALGSVADQLFDFSGKAAQAARAMVEAQKAFRANLADFQAKASGTTDSLENRLRDVKREADAQRQAAARAFRGSQQVLGNSGVAKPGTELERIYRAIAEAEAAYVARLKEEAALKLRMLNEDLDVRRLRALGLETEASAMAQAVANARELAEALKLTSDPIEQAIIRAKVLETQAAEASRRAADAAKAAIEKAMELQKKAEELMLANRRLAGDASVRALSAIGRGRDAEDARQFFNARQEMEDAIKAGMSPATLAMLAFAQVMEREAVATQRAIEDQTKVIRDAAAAEIASIDRQIEAVRLISEIEQAAFDKQLDAAKMSLDVARDQLRVQERAAEETRRVLESIAQFSAGLKLNTSLTTLSPIAQLAEAKKQYDELLAAANGGDKNAAGNLPAAARAYLDASRSVNASGAGYVADFRRVQDTLAKVTDKFGKQLTVEERILRELEAQTKSLEAQIVALQAAKEAAQERANAQIEALQKAKEQAQIDADRAVQKMVEQLTAALQAKAETSEYWNVFLENVQRDRDLANDYYRESLKWMRMAAEDARSGWEKIIEPIGELPPAANKWGDAVVKSNEKIDATNTKLDTLADRFDSLATLLQVGFKETVGGLQGVRADVGENTTQTRQGFEGLKLTR